MNAMYYDMIFKRKSFHLFRNVGKLKISPQELAEIEEAYKLFTPLYPNIKTSIQIVSAEKTSCNRGQEYCIFLYSEKKENSLQNIGYIGEQLDLYLVSKNIGTLWFGIGKTEEPSFEEFDFVIMLAISKVDNDNKFREDMFKSKRKSLEEIWNGNPIKNVTEIVRFAPSACNTQPWFVEHANNVLTVFRYKKQGKRGIMPAHKVNHYNQIDIGIFLCFMDICLIHEHYKYKKELFTDNGFDAEKIKVAEYQLLENLT